MFVDGKFADEDPKWGNDVRFLRIYNYILLDFYTY